MGGVVGTPRASGTRATRREEIVTMALASWTLVGLFVDAYKHSTDPGLETFWTPWHALFYSGFLATSGWIVFTILRRIPPGELAERGWLRAAVHRAPAGYSAALLGMSVFAIGGVGDAVWHTAFGVETSLDALLSPTHLLLWIGLLMVTSTPLRAAWRDIEVADDRDGVTFAPIAASLIITTSLVAFFFEYAWVLVDTSYPHTFFSTASDEFQVVAALGVLGIVVSTAILMTPVLLAARRWRLPFGVTTGLFGIVNLLLAVGFDEDPIGVIPALAGGFTADVLLRFTGDGYARGTAAYLVGGATPFVTWATYFVVAGRLAPLEWPPEIWGGGIVFGVLTGLAIAGGAEVVGELAVRRAVTSR